MNDHTLKACMATILADLYGFEQDFRGVQDPDFGDWMIGKQTRKTFEALAPLEAADPDDYAQTLRHFGPQAIHRLAHSLAGREDLLDFSSFRAACLRLSQPDLDAETATILSDPQNSFNGVSRLSHKNIQNDILSPWLEKVENWLESPDAPASDFPDSNDYFVLGVTLGEVSYGVYGEHMTQRAMDLIEEGLRLSDAQPAPDRATALRIATLLGAGGRALPGCGYGIFSKKESDALTLAQLIDNAAKSSADLYLAPIRGVEDFLKYMHKENSDPRYLQYQAALEARKTGPHEDEAFYDANARIALLREIYGDEVADKTMNAMNRSLLDIANKLDSLASVVAGRTEINPLFVFPVREALDIQTALIKERILQARSAEPEARPALAASAPRPPG